MNKYIVFDKQINNYIDNSRVFLNGNSELYIATYIDNKSTKIIPVTPANENQFVICEFSSKVKELELYVHDVLKDNFGNIYACIGVKTIALAADIVNKNFEPVSNLLLTKKRLRKVGTYLWEKNCPKKTFVVIPEQRKNTWICPLCNTPLLTKSKEADIDLFAHDELKKCPTCKSQINLIAWQNIIDSRIF